MKLYEAPIIAGGLVAAAGVGLLVGCVSNPPVKVGPPNMAPTTTIQTKPLPSRLEVHVCHVGERCIIWLDTGKGVYVHGPYDPPYAPALCEFNPPVDVYYSESNGQVLTSPPGCPT